VRALRIRESGERRPSLGAVRGADLRDSTGELADFARWEPALQE